MEKITFGAGCFWGVEKAFQEINGVISTQVGYSGGNLNQANYEQVCTGKTGHAEVVEVEFDSTLVSFTDLLSVFWQIHDPTTLNRQGPDVGSQYRSVIFFHSEVQKNLALKTKEEMEQSEKFSAPVVTEILPLKTFFRAEPYHQSYLKKKQT